MAYNLQILTDRELEAELTDAIKAINSQYIVTTQLIYSEDDLNKIVQNKRSVLINISYAGASYRPIERNKAIHAQQKTCEFNVMIVSRKRAEGEYDDIDVIKGLVMKALYDKGFEMVSEYNYQKNANGDLFMKLLVCSKESLFPTFA